ncbi:hypothetical protein [Anthocerotibacter panamensis]|uniref:hypothetical protein n=1 Tax=Anthocerotibacter panamensis TaxID=2857077 RepID=UPI001C40241D|nr:hypothetical protein [Anthocerotibacter panamensis]
MVPFKSALLILSLVLSILVPPLWAQDPQPSPRPTQPASFSVGVEAVDTQLDRRLSPQEMLKAINLTVDPKGGSYTFSICRDEKGGGCAHSPEIEEGARKGLTELVTLAITQQNRLGWISQVVRRNIRSRDSPEPDIDKLLNLLQAVYPEVNFKDPQALKVLRKNGKTLLDTFAGVLTEPSSIALFALIEPQLALESRIVALQGQLAHRGSWDPAGNQRLQTQIAQLQTVLGEGIQGDATNQTEQLRAMQTVLKEQGVPIPRTPEGGRVLVGQLFQRFAQITEGQNLPQLVDVVKLDRSGTFIKGFSKLDERIRQLNSTTADKDSTPR